MGKIHLYFSEADRNASLSWVIYTTKYFSSASGMGQTKGKLRAREEVPGTTYAAGEFPGRRSQYAETGSSDSAPYCQPCVNVLATAFCTDCRHYLCSPCTDHHRKLALTKTHTLLTGSVMPSVHGGFPVRATTRGKEYPGIACFQVFICWPFKLTLTRTLNYNNTNGRKIQR